MNGCARLDVERTSSRWKALVKMWDFAAYVSAELISSFNNRRNYMKYGLLECN